MIIRNKRLHGTTARLNDSTPKQVVTKIGTKFAMYITVDIH